MKRTLSLLLFAFCSLLMTKAAFATTWYVRPDGGTRYSSIMTSGQCDGLGDVAYQGAGVNQHCAFKDVRYLWQDGSYNVGTTFPSWGWVGSGGDTYLIRGSIGTNVSYRIGWNNPSSSCEATQCWGIQGNPYASYIPAPPSGTASAHTRLLGENYASCSAASAKTQLHGGYGLYTVLNMSGGSYVDVACFDITDFSSCSLSGGATTTCNKNIGSLSDFAGTGISWDTSATHDTLTNVHIHGLASNGMWGPTGDGMVFQYVDMIGNSSSGWNSDNGNGNSSAVGVGSLLVQNFNISWNGCTEEYPVVDALPYSQCSDDNAGGYGDGFGTATQPAVPQGWQVQFDQGVVSYNTQDGLDALHLVGPNSSMTITRVLAYGNMGQQIKVGGAKGTAQNNIVMTNCNALREPIPGTPSGYNALLSDFCRAADTGVLVTVGKGSTTTFDNNTIYSASATGVEIECDATEGNCDSTSLMDFRNNIFLGFQNSPANGYTGPYETGTLDYSNPIYNGTGLPVLTTPGSLFSNNLFFHGKSNFNCAAIGQTSGLCVDPLLTNENWSNYGYADVTPLASSPVIDKGIGLSAVSVDFAGTTRGNPSTIGAIEVLAAAPAAPTAPTISSSPTTPTSAGPTTPTTPVTKSATITTQAALTLSQGPSAQNPLVLTATIKAASGKTVPTGSILIFTSNNTPIATGVLSANGSFSWTVPASLSTQTVYGLYTGSSTFKSSTSPMLNEAKAMTTLYGK